MNPVVTALVDTYNHQQYIEQALVSVVEQGLSSSELEIVVVDDGSTDNTPSIIQKFVPRVKYLRKRNGGQASAFNAAFPEVKGQIVATLDGDDWWAKGKLAPDLDAFEKNPEVSAVSHAYYQFSEATKELKLCGPSERTFINLATPEAARLACRDWAFLPMGALTVRRTVLERVVPIPEVLVFLADTHIALASMAMGALVLPEPLSYYRFHASNLYAENWNDTDRMRRRLEMVATMAETVHPMLVRLGVPRECVSQLFNPLLIHSNRTLLSTFGGSRLRTFKTEMRIFHLEFENPRIGYLLYKYLVVGAATLLLKPMYFYKLRDWVARQDLEKFRKWARGQS